MPTDLFATSPEKACPAYKNIRAAKNEHCQKARAHCKDLWRDFEPLADNHFKNEFPVWFHQRWFEMYLTVTLIRAGYDVKCPKPGPDILINVDGQRIWVEATCASPGKKNRPDSVPMPRYTRPGEQPVVSDVPNDKKILRITNSLSEKEKKFTEYLDKAIVTPDDMFVIAINVHSIPFAWADMDELMLSALYGIGDLTLMIDRQTGEVVDHFYRHRELIGKNANSQVGVRAFVDGSLPHISAVIGSREDVANLPQRLGDGISLYPNLGAATQWRTGTVKRGTEWTFAQTDQGWEGRKLDYIP